MRAQAKSDRARQRHAEMEASRDRKAPPTPGKSCAASGPAHRVANQNLSRWSLRSPVPDETAKSGSRPRGLDVPATTSTPQYTAAAPQFLVSDGTAKAHAPSSVEREERVTGKEVLEIRLITGNFPRKSVSSDSFFLPRKAATTAVVHGIFVQVRRKLKSTGEGACRTINKHPM